MKGYLFEDLILASEIAKIEAQEQFDISFSDYARLALAAVLDEKAYQNYISLVMLPIMMNRDFFALRESQRDLIRRMTLVRMKSSPKLISFIVHLPTDFESPIFSTVMSASSAYLENIHSGFASMILNDREVESIGMDILKTRSGRKKEQLYKELEELSLILIEEENIAESLEFSAKQVSKLLLRGSFSAKTEFASVDDFLGRYNFQNETQNFEEELRSNAELLKNYKEVLKEQR